MTALIFTGREISESEECEEGSRFTEKPNEKAWSPQFSPPLRCWRRLALI